MEATGVYWIPLHDLLESRQIEVTVFNGAHALNMPGRKSDVQDCKWHGMLHGHGLLVACFIPSEEIRRLRCYYRLREDHLSIAAEHIQHKQRALDLMNVRLHLVISQIHGVSGLRVIKAILAGQRDPVALCELREGANLQQEERRGDQKPAGTLAGASPLCVASSTGKLRVLPESNGGLRPRDRTIAQRGGQGKAAPVLGVRTQDQSRAPQRFADRESPSPADHDEQGARCDQAAGNQPIGFYEAHRGNRHRLEQMEK